MHKWILVLALVSLLALPLTAAGETTYKKEYYDSGEIKSKTPYVNGKIHGVQQEFDKNGTLIKEFYYQHGEMQGEVFIEKKKDYDLGAVNFLKSWQFWAILIGVLVGLWFFFSKVLLGKSPF